MAKKKPNRKNKTALAAPTQSPSSACLVDPYDLSPILFSCSTESLSNAIPEERSGIQHLPLYIGPVELKIGGVVCHGRGLVTTRDICAGECLFVTPPTLEASIAQVKQLWQSQQARGTKLVEEVAETILVRAMTDKLHQAATCRQAAAIVNSFLPLRGHSDEPVVAVTTSSLDQLVGKDRALSEKIIEESNLRSLLRRNAFGPDFVTAESLQRRWTAMLAENKALNDSSFHVLGLYPLAAMINHSCVPNAVRVFCAYRDASNNKASVMIVHAAADIAAGQEIVWSYLPPTQTYKARASLLKQQYGFDCCCERCRVEQTFYQNWEPYQCYMTALDQWNHLSCRSQDNTEETEYDSFISAFEDFEQHVMKATDSNLTNQMKRYFRVGWTHASVRYLNVVLSKRQRQNLLYKPSDLEEQLELSKLLDLAAQLHFAFCSCDNASTVHLSVLHLCYDLISSLHAIATDPIETTLPKLRFWTEQLKRAHLVRFGSLGHEISNVRTVMQHTKDVLRKRDGIDSAKYQFI